METRRLDSPTALDKALEPVQAGRRLLTEREWRGSAGYRKPLNGQHLRQKTIRDLVRTFKPDAIVETGTCFGYSTGWFADLADVYTAEIDPGFFNVARRRLRDRDNVTLFCGRSTDALRELAREGTVKRPFAYLDAHWESDLPLGEEMEILLETWPEFVAAVDDFKVPGEEFGFDEYDEPLSLESFPLPDGVTGAFPAHPAADETGHKRGTLYFARGREATNTLQSVVDAGLLRIADGAAR